jgi:hypothetical protein
MRIKQSYALRFVLLITLIVSLTVLSSRMKADTGSCGGATTTLPFTDVMGNPFFCQIAEAYFSGLTSGTTATTYSPAANVTREQMAAFVTRTMDQSLKRGSERAVTEKWWTPQSENAVALTSVGTNPRFVQSDGADLWVANLITQTVSRVRASDGKMVGTWTGAINAHGVLVAMGRIFVTGLSSPGRLYQIDPTQPPGAVTLLSTGLGDSPASITFDGARIWTANTSGSVSIITLNPTTVNNVSTGFVSPWGVLYDGANIWVTDNGDDKLKKLDSSGAILQSVSVGDAPLFPVFDGTNIWVPNGGSDTVTVVRVKDSQGNPLANPFVLATLGGLNFPATAAFDGERILVTNTLGGFIALWKAADLTPLGLFIVGEGSLPWGACSDGLNFWITLQSSNHLARF